MRATISILVAGSFAIPSPGSAQSAYLPPRDSVTVVADSHFRRGGLGQWLLGRTYRDLWGTPIRVEVLDPSQFAGGLTPVERGGGLQTRSLRLKGADGREYQFRLVRKDPGQVVGEELNGTIVGDLVRDQMSAIHPGGSLVAPPLLKIAGVLHAPPRLRFMKDHPVLGEFRQEFGDQLGTIEERPEEGDVGKAGFAGATRVENTEGLLEALREQPTVGVNSRSYLKTRLIDFLIGDWDRHEDQYRWALIGTGASQQWEPIPRDRDQAFVRYDGALLGLTRVLVPKLIVYDEKFPSAAAQTYNGRHLDRRILNNLEWSTWDSLTKHVQSLLTDKVIEDAVGELPREYEKSNGATLRRILKARRDHLPDAARDFYRYMSGQVLIEAGHINDRLDVVRQGDGRTEIRISRAGDSTPYYRRTFRPDETREIRVYLHDGADRVRFEGKGPGPKIRLIGGAGADTVSGSGNPQGLLFYDADSITVLDGLAVDRKPYAALADTVPGAGVIPIQDWGSTYQPEPKVHLAAYSGLSLGMELRRQGYGFRRHPYSSLHSASLEWSFKRAAPRVMIATRWRQVNRQTYFGFQAMGSGMEGGRFFGFGDSNFVAGDADRFLALRKAFEASPYVGWGLESPLRLWLFVRARHTITDMSNQTNFTSELNRLRPPGLGDVGQLGPAVRFEVDTRDTEDWASKGVFVRLDGEYFPVTWANADGPHGAVEARASTYLSLPSAPDRLTLALRAGGRQVFGDFPYFESSFLGGKGSLRGYSRDRFAGDRSVFGQAELRLKLLESRLVLPTEIGIMGLADGGRVWFKEKENGTWHTDFGGGIWIGVAERHTGISLGLAKGQERGRFWLAVGSTF